MSVLPRPDVPPARPWTFPVVEDHRLPSGLRVRVLDLPGQHVVAVRLAVPGSLSAEPREIEGIASIMARCLDEGTRQHTSEQMAARIEQEGIALAAGVGERGLVVELEVTGSRLPAALQILAECLAEPAFPEAEVARAVRARLTEIEHELADPAARAGLEFLATYHRDGDRASRPVGGTRESVATITAEQVRALHAATIGPASATLVVAGDLSGMPAAPENLAERAFAGWSGAGPNGPARAASPEVARRAEDASRIVVVDRPSSPQTELYLGRPGPDRRTRHGWGAYQVLAFLLGGSPTSRVDAVLREERGYTYGIRLGFRSRRSGGICVVNGAVRAEATVPALATLHEVLSLTGQELSAPEVEHAADFVAKTAPGRYATADAVADEVVRLALDDLDVSTVSETVAQAASLTQEQAAAAWDEVANGPGWTAVVVGDARHAEAAELGALGLGAVSVVSAPSASLR